MDNFDKKLRSAIMGRVRSRDTTPERRVHSFLHRNGFRFRLRGRKLPGSPDIVLPARNAVVFVHGCFWHQHEGCVRATKPKTRRGFWSAKFEKNRARDRTVLRKLRSLGWRVFVVWECDSRNEKRLSRLVSQLRAGDRDGAP